MQQLCQSAFSADEVEVLFSIAEAIASHCEINSLLHDLPDLLHTVIEFNFLSLVLPDPAETLSRSYVLETAVSMDQDSIAHLLLERESPAYWAFHNQQPLRCDIQELQIQFPEVSPILCERGVGSICLLPLTIGQYRIGVLGLGRAEQRGYRDSELQLIDHLARSVASAINRIAEFEHLEANKLELALERDQLQTLLNVNNALVSRLDLRELLAAISSCIRRVLGNEFTTLSLHDTAADMLRLHALDLPGGKGAFHEGTLLPLTGSPAGVAFTSKRIYTAKYSELASHSGEFGSDVLSLLLAEGVKAVCCVPLVRRGVALGTLNVLKKQDESFPPSALALLEQIGAQVAIAVENALTYDQISKLKDKLTSEKLYLEEEIRSNSTFGAIVGESAALRNVLGKVQTVASSDSNVLVMGETGTGKELIARAIHNLSDRRDRTFVKVNCAAIPTGLLESELFGHEKGAFTGAVRQKIGRFELAHEGTLFLDEVGDLPLELQPKLLRVLQEKELEHLGSNRTIHVNVRLVAATNQDLHRMVAERRFRGDLYYRLNVFPILIPPLRERREDIPLLVRYFTKKYAQRMNRQIETIPTTAMEALKHWEWSGNVRELENVIERSVILTQGSVLNVPLAELAPTSESSETSPAVTPAKTREEERAQIVRALREANGIVAGPRGAASRLGLKRTTLLSRMQRLGIGSTMDKSTQKAKLTEADERKHVLQVLRATNGLVSGPRGAAARLGLKRTTLISRMQRLGISPKSIT